MTLLRAASIPVALGRRHDIRRHAWRYEHAAARRGNAQRERPLARRPAEALSLVNPRDEDAPHDHHQRHQSGQRDDEAQAAEDDRQAMARKVGRAKRSTSSPAQSGKAASIAQAFSPQNLKGSVSGGFIDSAWDRISQGKKLLFSDKAGTLENKIQSAADAGQIKSREDVANMVKQIKGKP